MFSCIFAKTIIIIRQREDNLKKRLNEVAESIDKTGVYEHTIDELSYGGQMAWRNAPRCIGRIQWAKLQVCLCI
jgi:nitric oxide synthase oxygenase domain/subunit